MKDLSFCPSCGKKSLQYIDNRYWFCPSCKLKLYNNIAAAAGLIIPIEIKDQKENVSNFGKSVDGKFYNVLFVKRGRNPQKGFYALPGGFVDPEESAENACLRECIEETGYKPKKIKFVCTAPNIYEYAGIMYKTCDIFFSTSVIECNVSNFLSQLNHKEEDEIIEYKIFPCNTISEIDLIPIAFASAKVALKEWIKKREER